MSNKGETMNKQAFNELCASIMGYEVTISMAMASVVFPDEPMPREYDPYEDLNQMAEVVERLADDCEEDYYPVELEKCLRQISERIPIKQAFRAFIESTAGDKQ